MKMASEGRSEYLWEQIVNHIALFFPSRAKDLVVRGKVRFLPFGEAVHTREPVIGIPNDIPAPHVPREPYRVPFNGTNLTLWNRIPLPDGGGWSCLPSAGAPLWYRHRSGTLLPAYNMFANMLDLLTLREERESARRDEHGRFPAEASPRHAAGLLTVPVFNEGVAALVAGCAGLAEDGPPRFDLCELAPTVALVLSHDCDILLGNDVTTQSIRLLRVFLPLLRAKAPHFANLWWTVRNAVRPGDFYFDNVAGMVDVERMSGFTSTFYMLNGTGGRFGARSRPQAIAQVARDVPDGWQFGMHYNYDTHLDSPRFAQQKQDLETILRRDVPYGRSHYLRFDPEKSWAFLAEHGIICDESVGYPDAVGYRCGIAGIFQPFDEARGRKVDIWEVPLVAMDGVLLSQYPQAPVSGFRKLLSHLGRVGGALSLIFHPGVFHNPEFPRFTGVYRRILAAAREHNSRSESTASLREKAFSGAAA